GAYDCGDGKAVLISIQNEREWRSLCENVLGDAAIAEDKRFATNPARVANRPALDAIILEAFGQGPREAIIEKLETAKVAYGRLSSLDDLVAHPQNRFVSVETVAGTVQVLAPPPIAVGEAESYGPVPALGEHDGIVRAEFAD
ncbi:MAG: CoA transferase, partial [Rhodospirillales bacterium]